MERNILELPGLQFKQKWLIAHELILSNTLVSTNQIYSVLTLIEKNKNYLVYVLNLDHTWNCFLRSYGKLFFKLLT